MFQEEEKKNIEKLSFSAKDNHDIEVKLDEADILAETVKERYSHEEVFDALRRRLSESC